MSKNKPTCTEALDWLLSGTRDGTHSLVCVNALTDELTALRRDAKALREAMSRVATAIGNGSKASPDCSLEFLCENVPDEVLLECASLRNDARALRQRVSVLEEALKAMMSSANPEKTEHPAMWKAWQKARAALNQGKK